MSISSTIMRTLQERNWIRVVGHREVPGRPELLGTTREFLDYFGLKSLDQLPTLAELKDVETIGVQLELPGGEVPAEALAEARRGLDAGSRGATSWSCRPMRPRRRVPTRKWTRSPTLVALTMTTRSLDRRAAPGRPAEVAFGRAARRSRLTRPTRPQPHPCPNACTNCSPSMAWARAARSRNGCSRAASCSTTARRSPAIATPTAIASSSTARTSPARLKITAAPQVLIYHKAAGSADRHRRRRDRRAGRMDKSVMESLPAVRGARWLVVNTMQPGDSGLLLLTSDGRLADALASPRRNDAGRLRGASARAEPRVRRRVHSARRAVRRCNDRVRKHRAGGRRGHESLVPRRSAPRASPRRRARAVRESRAEGQPRHPGEVRRPRAAAGSAARQAPRAERTARSKRSMRARKWHRLPIREEPGATRRTARSRSAATRAEPRAGAAPTKPEAPAGSDAPTGVDRLAGDAAAVRPEQKQIRRDDRLRLPAASLRSSAG